MIKGKIEKLKKCFISISRNQTALKILFGVVMILLLCAIPFIALKHGASGDGFLGYFGAVIGGAIGALVAGWGIITTIKENRRQAVAPCLIFQEVDEVPENTEGNSYLIVHDGNEIVYQTVLIKNVGVGAAIDCKMKGVHTLSFHIADIIEKDTEKYIQIGCYIKKLDNSRNKEWTQEEIKDYAIQSERIPVIFEYKNVLGEDHSYELIVNLQCSIICSNGNIDDPKCSPTLKLISWKPLQ